MNGLRPYCPMAAIISVLYLCALLAETRPEFELVLGGEIDRLDAVLSRGQRLHIGHRIICLKGLPCSQVGPIRVASTGEICPVLDHRIRQLALFR